MGARAAGGGDLAGANLGAPRRALVRRARRGYGARLSGLALRVVDRAARHVRGEGRRLEVLVWERGVGPTEACGTGACAVAAEACREGRSPFGEPIEVALPGGPLTLVVGEGTFAVEMTGPARRTFTGRVARDPRWPNP